MTLGVRLGKGQNGLFVAGFQGRIEGSRIEGSAYAPRGMKFGSFDPATLQAPGAAEATPVEEDAPDLGGLAPSLERAESFGRSGNPIRGLDGANLVRAVFDMAEGETMPSEPLRVGSEFVIFQVTDRQSAVREEFTDEEQARIRDGLRSAKQREVLTQHIAGLRAQAERDEAIFINPEILRYGDEVEETEEDAEDEEDGEAAEGEGSAAPREDEAEPAPAEAAE